jgi:hypothetical protein
VIRRGPTRASRVGQVAGEPRKGEMTTMGNLPQVVSREEWLAARRELLAKET